MTKELDKGRGREEGIHNIKRWIIRAIQLSRIVVVAVAMMLVAKLRRLLLLNNVW